jgi:purine-binding chemotaxis protein CheW
LKVETVPVDSLQVITFSLVNETTKKKENYAVPIEQIREIRNFSEITTVPKAKKFVIGVMNLRGLIIPVIDIKKRLGFGEADMQNPRNYKIIIADVRDSIYGLIVDKVEHVMKISPEEIEPVPSDSFESYHYIKGIAKTQGHLLVLLDIIALLEDSDENQNDQFQEELEIHTTNVNQTPVINSETNSNLEESDDDIPEELKEVFREDEQENLSTEVPK